MITDTLLERVGGSQELLHEIIGLFLEDAPKLLADIRTALQNGDAQGSYRAAHTLKGSAGNFDAQAVVEAAQRLEACARETDIAGAKVAFAALEVEMQAILDGLAQVGETLTNEGPDC